ncbi:hypothetical protein EW026_g4123 [Hermanssonia centrifuga]|uniref:Uncharacterized protein n=1 Tax=Hermanssonia centrifuga TaxID=98765 RepID=A0A4S4KJB2_9APHY|nr:hypothetical protein EW026_g4123 [Hermanssonia centrifuga]
MPYSKHWSDQELVWLKTKFASEEVRAIVEPAIKSATQDEEEPKKVKRGRANGHQDGELKQAASYLFDNFPEEFRQPRKKESTEDFMRRKFALQGTGATVQKTRAESDADHQDRMEHLFDNLYKWVQNNSPNRGKKPTPSKSLNPFRTPRAEHKKSALDLYRKERTVVRQASDDKSFIRTDGKFDLVKWNAITSWEFKALESEERDRLQAEADEWNAEAVARLAVDDAEYERRRLVAELPQLIRDNWEYQKQKTGWVGLTVAGGVDEHGRIVQMTHCVHTDYNERTLIDRICEKIGWSTSRWDSEMMRFFEDVFDPPIPPLGKDGTPDSALPQSSDGGGTSTIMQHDSSLLSLPPFDDLSRPPSDDARSSASPSEDARSSASPCEGSSSSQIDSADVPFIIAQVLLAHAVSSDAAIPQENSFPDAINGDMREDPMMQIVDRKTLSPDRELVNSPVVLIASAEDVNGAMIDTSVMENIDFSPAGPMTSLNGINASEPEARVVQSGTPIVSRSETRDEEAINSPVVPIASAEDVNGAMEDSVMENNGLPALIASAEDVGGAMEDTVMENNGPPAPIASLDSINKSSEPEARAIQLGTPMVPDSETRDEEADPEVHQSNSKARKQSGKRGGKAQTKKRRLTSPECSTLHTSGTEETTRTSRRTSKPTAKTVNNKEYEAARFRGKRAT